MLDLAAYTSQRQGRQVWSAGWDQCVALARDWIEANGWELPSGSTAGGLTFPAPWVRLPIDRAQAGDLVQWLPSLPGSQGDGHIALYLYGRPPGFVSFDQNWSCACSAGDCPCCCQIDHQDPSRDLPYVAGAWRWVPPPPVVATEPPELISRTVVVSPAGPPA